MHTIFPVLLALLQGPPEPDWLGAFIEGNRALERGDASAAKTALETALAALPEHAATAWQLACACARRHEDDAAFAWLERVVAWGGGDPALLAWDSDLASLREDPRFAQIAESLAARAPDEAEPIEGRLVLEGGGAITSVGPGARIVATGRGAGTLIFDTTTDEIVAALDRPGEDIASVFVSPDGRHVVAGGSTEGQSPEHFLRVFDASTGDLVRELDEVGWQPWTQFSRDGRRMLAAGGAQARSVLVWNTSDWSTAPIPPDGGDQHVLSPEGSRILILQRADGAHSNLVLWDVDAGKELRRHDELATIPNTELEFSSDGALALVVENGSERVLILDGRTGEVVQAWKPATRAPVGTRSFNACLVGARGEFALIDEKLRIEVRDARTGEVRRTFQVPGEPGWRGIESSTDGRSLLVSGFGSSTTMVDADDGAILWRDDGQSGFGTGFAPDGQSFVHGSWREPPQVRATRTGRTLYEVRAPGRGSAFDADPTREVVWVGAEDGSVRCVSAVTGRTLRAWKLADARIHSVAASPDSKGIAAIDGEGTLRVVDAAKGTVSFVAPAVVDVEAFSFGDPVVFAPASDALIVVERGPKLGVYAAPTWDRRCTIATDAQWYGPFAWSPDGASIAVGLGEGLVRIHDARDGTVRGAKVRIANDVGTLAFEPDGARLWVGSSHSKVHVFRTADQQEASTLDLSDLDDFDTVELGSISFRRDGKLAITASSGFGVVAAWDPADGRRVWSYSYGGGNPAPLHSAFAADGERAFVWGQTWWTARVVDARTGNKLLDFAGRLGTLLPLPGKGRLAGLGHEGLEVVDLRDGRTLWTRAEVDAEGWLLSTPARFVDGTQEALERIPFAMEGGSLPLDALAAALLDPKKVRAAAEGVAIAPARAPVIPTLHATEPHERVVALAAGAKPRMFRWVASCPDGVRGFELVLEGRRFVTDGDVDGPHKRTLQYEIDAEPGTPTDLRIRAISRRGILSRALRLTVRRE